jgi:homoserine dehydrogenase
VLSKITAILAEHEISVEAILQREPRGEEDATLAIITNVVGEARFDDAATKIESLSFVREKASRIRVEHFRD